MKPARLSRTGMRNGSRTAYRTACRPGAGHRRSARPMHRVAARLRPGMHFWCRPPNPARLVCTLVRRLLKFHERDPMLRSLITDH
jgi:hypothetical protein